MEEKELKILKKKVERNDKMTAFKDDKNPKPPMIMWREFLDVSDKLESIKDYLKDFSEKGEEPENEYYDDIQKVVDAIDDLREAFNGKDMSVNIPLDDLASAIGNVEKAVKQIPQTVIPTVSDYTYQLGEISEKISDIEFPEFPVKEMEKLLVNLGKEITTKLKKEEKEFDYKKIDELIKAVKNIKQGNTVVTNNGYKNVGLENTAGAKINPATEEKQDSLLTELQKKADVTETQPVSIASLPLPSGGATSANQTNGTQIAQMYGKTGDATFQVPRLDVATHTLQTIDYAHHEIHAGSHYFVVGVQTLANNNVLDFTWVMPNTTKWVHWLWKLDTSMEVEWYVYEGAVITNALANTITPSNSDRNSLNASGTTMKYELQATLAAANTDTNVTGATLIKSGISGAGKQVGGTDGRENEIILKQNTIYCLRAVARAAGYIDFDMEWYEHTNKTA